ncbi:MAG: signal recognition particle-docking protein FtsY [Candidatus Pacearchaeota archaeon]
MFKFLKEKLGKLLGAGDKEEKVDEIDIVESKEEKISEKAKETTSERKERKKQEEFKEEKQENKEENKEEIKHAIEELEGEIKELEEEKIKLRAPEIKPNTPLSITKEAKPEVKIEKKIEEGKPAENIRFFSKFSRGFSTIRLSQDIFNEFFEKLELVMLENNVSLQVVDKIKEDMEKKLINIELKKSELENEIKTALKESLSEILMPPFDIVKRIKEKPAEKGPFIILFFGINGSGKTTSIAKVANMLKSEGIISVLAAGDTFRAASIEQLENHGEKLGLKVIRQSYGADPAAVGFDAIQYAKSHGIKAVLIDTAGRMHTQSNLLKEMEKIVRVTSPDLKIFVAESITGNDATEQAKSFDEAFKIDGTILTKADVDEKGGTAVSIGYVTKKPVLFLGTGQTYDNLEVFSPKEVIANLGLD